MEHVLLHDFIKECPTLFEWQEEEKEDLENETLEEAKQRVTLRGCLDLVFEAENDGF